MPMGRDKFDLEFRGGALFLLKLLTATLLVNFVVSFAIERWVTNSWPRHATSSCTYSIRFVGGVSVFVPRFLGYYLEWSFWGHFVLLALIFLVLTWYAKTGRAAVTWRP